MEEYYIKKGSLFVFIKPMYLKKLKNMNKL